MDTLKIAFVTFAASMLVSGVIVFRARPRLEKIPRETRRHVAKNSAPASYRPMIVSVILAIACGTCLPGVLPELTVRDGLDIGIMIFLPLLAAGALGLSMIRERRRTIDDQLLQLFDRYYLFGMVAYAFNFLFGLWLIYDTNRWSYAFGFIGLMLHNALYIHFFTIRLEMYMADEEVTNPSLE